MPAVYAEQPAGRGAAAAFLPTAASIPSPLSPWSRQEPGPPITITPADRQAIERAAGAILAVRAWWRLRSHPHTYPGPSPSAIIEDHLGAAGRKWAKMCSLAKRRAEELAGAQGDLGVSGAVLALGVPGIGRTLAARLAAHFPTPRLLQTATPGELEQVDGVGPETAATLHRRLPSCAELDDLAARPACSPASPPSPQASPREAADA